MEITKINYPELNQQAEAFLASNDSEGAMDKLNELKTELAKLPAETQVPDELVICFAKLRLAALDMLPRDQIKQVLTEHAVLALNFPDYALKEQIESYLMAYPTWQRNAIKQEFLTALEANEEKFTEQELTDSKGQKSLAPTVKHWLYLYAQAGGSQELNPLSRTQFIFHSGNGGKLNPEEQQKLVRLITFYEYLKQDAQKPENAADKIVFNFDGQMAVYDHDKFYGAENAEKSAVSPDKTTQLGAEAPRLEDARRAPASPSQGGLSSASPDGSSGASPDIKLQPEPWKNSVVKQTASPKPLNIVFEKAKPVLPVRPKFTVTPPQNKVFKPSFSQAQSLMQEAKMEVKQKPLPAPILSPIKQTFNPPLTQPIVLARNKNLVTDIKAPRLNAVMDLTDELGRMSLAEFRNLGNGPKASAEKIKEKIELLAEESIVKKSVGILAWKKSPVQKLYFQLGQESMLRNVNIKELISEKVKNNQETLTEEEFSSLADLNHQLRF